MVIKMTTVMYNAENSPVRWVGATHFRGPLCGASRVRAVQAVACLYEPGVTLASLAYPRL